jgi:hypothetical protein
MWQMSIIDVSLSSGLEPTTKNDLLLYTVLDVRLPVTLGARFADEAPTTLESCRR